LWPRDATLILDARADGHLDPGRKGSVRTALVTGASRRLGRVLALELAARGYRIAIHYRSDEALARETLAGVRARGSDGAVLRADLRSVEDLRRLVAEAARELGGLDALVHSASPWVEGPFATVREGDWDDVFAVGPRAAFFLAQAAAPLLRPAGGSILLVSDVAATRAWPDHIPHAAAKAAVEALVRNLAVALGPGVRVNGIAPGIVLPPDTMDEETVERLVARTPLRRRVDPDELAALAATLLESPSVTGHVLVVDAGRSVA
jgi:pteridine reductase